MFYTWNVKKVFLNLNSTLSRFKIFSFLLAKLSLIMRGFSSARLLSISGNTIVFGRLNCRIGADLNFIRLPQKAISGSGGTGNRLPAKCQPINY